MEIIRHMLIIMSFSTNSLDFLQNFQEFSSNFQYSFSIDAILKAFLINFSIDNRIHRKFL